jgi:prepilin-type N-terminal cleavage/methylation domain-containing protein
LRNKSGGFTLLEVVIALAIAGALFVSVLEAVNYQLSVVGRYQDTSVAMMLGQEKIMELSEKPETVSGTFPAPYDDYSFESKIGDGPLPILNVLTLNVTKGRETTTLKIFIKK